MGKEDKNKKVRIPDEVEEFLKLSYKKFKKKNSDEFEKEKHIRNRYRAYVAYLADPVVDFLITKGYRQEYRETRDEIYDVLTKPDKKNPDGTVLGSLTAAYEEYLDDNYAYDGMEKMYLFPIIGFDMIRTQGRADEEEKKTDPSAEKYDVSDIVNLIRLINKKKLKKLVEKDEIDEDVAFDALCVIPHPSVIQGPGHMYRLKQLFLVLYEHAKKEGAKPIKFDKLIARLVKKEQYRRVIAFALLERKDKYVNFTDAQKELYNQITVWCVNTLEEMDNDEIYQILTQYVSTRKADKAKGQDSARRYFLSSLPESDYPSIHKIMERMKVSDKSVEEFF